MSLQMMPVNSVACFSLNSSKRLCVYPSLAPLSPLTTPGQTSTCEVVGVGRVDMATFPGNLIDTDDSNARKITTGWDVFDRFVNCDRNRTPRAVKKGGNLLPSRYPGQGCDHGTGKLFFAVPSRSKFDKTPPESLQVTRRGKARKH